MPITEKKLRDKLLKEKELDVAKIVEQIQEYMRQKEQKEYYTGNTNIKPKERNQRRTHTQKTDRKIRNKTERKAKRTKLQILQRTKLAPQPQMSSPTEDMSYL